MNDDDELETVFTLPLWAIILIALLCWPAAVLSQDKLIPLHVYEDQSVLIHLMASPCPEEILQLIKPDKRALYKNALDSHWRMRNGGIGHYSGCWREFEDKFYLVFSDGEGFVVPKAAFTKGQGTGI